MLHRQCNNNCRTLSRFAIGCYNSQMAFHNSMANRETYSITLITSLAVQTLKGFKNSPSILYIKTNTIILYAYLTYFIVFNIF